MKTIKDRKANGGEGQGEFVIKTGVKGHAYELAIILEYISDITTLSYLLITRALNEHIS